MNAKLDGRMYVRYTCPVTNETARVPQQCQLGKAVIAGDVETVRQLTVQAERDRDRQIRVAELRGRTGRSLAWMTLHNHALKHGKTFTIHLIPMVNL